MKSLAPQGFTASGCAKAAPSGLEFQEKLLDLGRRVHHQRGRQQFFFVAQRGVDDRNADAAEVEPRPVPLHLAIVRRLAIGKDHGEAELFHVEGVGRPDVGDEGSAAAITALRDGGSA